MFNIKHEDIYGDKDEKRRLFETNKVCAREFLKDAVDKYKLQADDNMKEMWELKVCGKKKEGIMTRAEEIFFSSLYQKDVNLQTTRPVLASYIDQDYDMKLFNSNSIMMMIL